MPGKFDEDYARKKARSLLKMGMSYSYILKDLTGDSGLTPLINTIIIEENEKLVRKGIKTTLVKDM